MLILTICLCFPLSSRTHFQGGGDNAVKHGDLDNTLQFPSARIDVHMGANDMQCVDCHLTRDHRVVGRAITVSVDRENRLYAVDAAFSNVQIFNAEGQLLLVLGAAGAEPGDMYLPAKIAIDYDNVELFADWVAPGHEVEYLILVTNQYGPHKINVYGFQKESTSD